LQAVSGRLSAVSKNKRLIADGRKPNARFAVGQYLCKSL
jgi:hypothetical protein